MTRAFETQSPWQLTWARLRANRVAMAGLWTLAALYAIAALAGFVAPHHYATQFRQQNWHPPHLTRLHLWDEAGTFHGPFVYGTVRSDLGVPDAYPEDQTTVVPIDLFVRGDRYLLFGLFETDVHLFGPRQVDATQIPLFLLGSDRLGRDVLSRILYGSRISLSVGLLGILISMSISLLVGGIAGYIGGATDFVLMRIVELLLAVPSLYLVLTLRYAFGQALTSTQSYLLIVAVLALVGWAANGRVIRGMVLSIRSQDYVLAARAMGLGRWAIVTRHILPNTMSYVIVAATLYVPYYILGETALSFLGMGIQEPEASWGNMLRTAQNITYLTEYPWVVAPGGLIFLTVMAFNFLGDGLRDASDPTGPGRGSSR